MKKRTMVLGGLLMAVAITGYSVSGTYAKYISGVDETDEARVAKWSFGPGESEYKVANLFKSSYSLLDDELTEKCAGTMTAADYKKNQCVVKSFNDDDVVAPGTKGSYTFDLSGDMETNYTLKISLDGTNNVVLSNAEAGIAGENVVSTDTAYNPLRFRLVQINADNTETTKIKWSTFDDFVTLFNLNKTSSTGGTTIFGSTTNKVLETVQPAGTMSLGKYRIDWAWAFDFAELKADLGSTANSTLHLPAVGVTDANAIALGLMQSGATTSVKTTAYTNLVNKMDTLLGNKVVAALNGTQFNGKVPQVEDVTVSLKVTVLAEQSKEVAGTSTVTPVVPAP